MAQNVPFISFHGVSAHGQTSQSTSEPSSKLWPKAGRILLALLVIISGAAAADITTGLQAQWSFSEGNGATSVDGTGHGNTATLQSGAYWSSGPISSGILLDGTGSLSVLSSASLSISGDMSVSAWIKVYDPQLNAAMRIISKKTAFSDVTGYDMTYNPASGVAAFIGSGSTQAYGVMHLDAAWHHIACSVAGTSVQMYIDGAAIPMTVGTVNAIQAGTTNVSMGRMTGSSGYFTGNLDEVRVYSRALAAADVAALTSSETPQATMIWPFNEGTGTVANDATANGHTGAIHGGTWLVDPTKGKVLSFDGSATYVQTADTPSLEITGGLTLSAWIKPNNLAYPMKIISKKGAFTEVGGYQIQYKPSTSVIAIIGANGANIAYGTASLGTAWHHVAGTISGATAQIYVDGLPIAMSSALVDALMTSTQPLNAGIAGDSSGIYSGLMSDLRIYSGAMTAPSIRTLAGLPAATAPTIVTAAITSPNPTTSLTIGLDVLGSDAGGESTLAYTWNCTNSNASIAYSINGSNAAKHTTATVPSIGSYIFQATIRNQAGLAITSSVTVSVVAPVDPPTISPAGGSFFGTQTVTLVPHPSSAAIWYTSGSAPADPVPGAVGATQYTVPFSISASTTIKAVSVTGSGSSQKVSLVASAAFVGINSTTLAYANAPPSGGSPTSPFCVEFTTPTTGFAITMDGNGVAATDLHVIGPNLVFGNVPLAANVPTVITTRVHPDSGSDVSRTETVAWATTDLAGKDAATAKITIRHGDSLLFIDSSAAATWTLDPGTGTGPKPIAKGAKVPTPYLKSGTYTAVAADLSGTLGSMLVTVVDAPFPSTEVIAAEVGYPRPYAVTLMPGGDAQDIVLAAADTTLMEVLEDGAHTTYASQAMTLKPLQRGFPVVVARLGVGGPIISWKEVTEFTLDQPDTPGLVGRGGGYGAFAMHPYIPGLTFTFTGVLATQMSNASDQTVVSDTMKRGYDRARSEVTASHLFTGGFSSANGPSSWQLTATQNVADSTAPGGTRKQQVNLGGTKTSPIYDLTITLTQPTGTSGNNFAQGGFPEVMVDGATPVADAATVGAPVLPGFPRGADFQLAAQVQFNISPANALLWSRLYFTDTYASAYSAEMTGGTLATLETSKVDTLGVNAPLTITRNLIYYGGAGYSLGFNGAGPLGYTGYEFYHSLLLQADLDNDGIPDGNGTEIDPRLHTDFEGPKGASPSIGAVMGSTINGFSSSSTWDGTQWKSNGSTFPTEIVITLDATTQPNVIFTSRYTPLPSGAAQLEVIQVNSNLQYGSFPVTVKMNTATGFRLNTPGLYSVGGHPVRIIGGGAIEQAQAGGGRYAAMNLQTWDSRNDAQGQGGTTRTNQIAWDQIAGQTQLTYAPVVFGDQGMAATVTRDTFLGNLLNGSGMQVFATGQTTGALAVPNTSGGWSFADTYTLDSYRDIDETFGYQVNSILSQSSHIVRLSGQIGPVTAFDQAVTVLPGFATLNLYNGNLHLAVPVHSYPGANPGPDLVLHFNSRDAIDCGYGPGWRTNYEMHVYRAGRDLAMIDLDSNCIAFDTNGHAAPDLGRHLAMDLAWKDQQAHGGTPSFDWQTGEMYRVSRNDNRLYYFDAKGFLVRIHQVDGHEFHIARDSIGIAQSVQDDFGRSEDLKPATLNMQAGAANAFTRENSGIWTFAYDAQKFMTDLTISDVIGGATTARVHLHLSYDKFAQVTTVVNLTDAGLDTTVSYYDTRTVAPFVTTVTTPLSGTSTLFGFDRIQDAVNILHVASATSSFIALATDTSGTFNTATKQGQVDSAYDAVGNLISQTVYDRAGHQQVTTWSYTDMRDKDPTILGVNLLAAKRVIGVDGIDGVGTCDLLATYCYQAASGTTRGKLLSVTDMSGSTTSNSYDTSTGNLTGTTDARGKVWAFGNFNAVGQPQLVTAPGTPTRTVSRTYNPDGTLSSETDVQAGFITAYGYDTMGRQNRVTPPGTSSDIITTYDALGRVLSTRDVNGYTVSSTYDSLGRQLSERRAGAADILTTYAKVGSEWLATQRRGSSTNPPFAILHTDFAGRTTVSEVFRTFVGGTAAATSCRTTNTYDLTYGWLTKVTDARNNAAILVPDLIGRTTKVTTPEGGVTNTVYNGLGWVLSVTDPDGAIATTTYTAGGQVCRTINPAGGSVETRYDPTGNVVAVVPSLGGPTSITYDDAGTVLTQTSATGLITSRAVNPTAKTITTTVTAANPDPGDTPTVTTTTLDTRGFPASVANTLGTATMTMYNDGSLNKLQPPGHGQLVRSRDPSTFLPIDDAIPLTLQGGIHQTVHQQTAYDPTFTAPSQSTAPTQHKVKEDRDPVTGEVNATWDNVTSPTGTATAPLTSIVSRDANGNVLDMRLGGLNDVVQTYDKDNRPLTRTAKKTTTAWTYSPGGRVRTLAAGGVTTTYAYNALGQTTSTMAPGRTVRTTAYDSLGTMVQSSDGFAYSDLVYDPTTRQLLQRLDSNGKATTYQYDARGRTKDVADNRGSGVHTAYDIFNRPTLLTYKDNKTEQFTYEPTGEVKTHVDRGGRTVTYTRDETGRLLTSVTSTGTTVTFDLALPATGGSVSSSTTSGKFVSRTSDVRGRLATLSMTGAADATFSYFGDDSPNQRAGTTYTYNSDGTVRTIAEGGNTATLAYDANGKVSSVTLPNGMSRTYLYDPSGALGELQQVPGSSAAEDWMLTRDGQGRMAQVTGPDGTTTFIYDETGRLVQERRKDTSTTIKAPSPAIVQYGYDGSDNRAAVVTYVAPADSIETFSGTSLPATVQSASGTWSEAAGVLSGNAGKARLVLTASPTLRCPAVSVQVKPTAPASGGTPNTAGLEVTSSTGVFYRALWRVGPPVAGDFNGLPQGSLVVQSIGTTTTNLAVSAPVGDDGTLRTITLTIWPDDRISAQADGSGLGGTLRVDVPAPGVSSAATTLPALNLVATGAATFDQLSWSVATSRTVRSASYDLFNRLTSDSEASTVSGVATATTTYGYDTFDRLQARTRTQGAATVATTYGYDDFDRMTSVAVGGSTQATMTYFGDSWMRATEVAGGATTSWTYDGAQILTQTTGALTVSFAHHAGQALWEHDNPATTAGLRIYAYDPFGNVRGHIATMTSGTVTRNVYQRQFAYDAYGTVLREQIAAFNAGNNTFGLAPISGAPTSGLRAKGMFLDGGLNLYKTQTRSYAADLGRFTQADPAKAGSNWYAYCGGDPVNRSDSSGLDWEWISGQAIMGADDRPFQVGTRPGKWKFVSGSDPSVPMPLVPLDELETKSPKVPNGADGLPTVDLNYFTANASVIDPRFDANYDRTPYLRDNAVYNAVVDGLGQQMGVTGLSAAAQIEALAKIDAIGVRASWVRGRAQTSTMSYLDSSFWAQGGGALDQLQAQTANASMLYGLTTLTGAGGDLALAEAGGSALQSISAARNLARISGLSARGLAADATVAERNMQQLLEGIGGKSPNPAVRQWYLDQVGRIPDLNMKWAADGLNLRQRAQAAWAVRHDARIGARLRMHDEAQVREFRARDVVEYGGSPDGPSFAQAVAERRALGMTLEEAYEAVITGATKTNSAVNRAAGVGGP